MIDEGIYDIRLTEIIEELDHLLVCMENFLLDCQDGGAKIAYLRFRALRSLLISLPDLLGEDQKLILMDGGGVISCDQGDNITKQ